MSLNTGVLPRLVFSTILSASLSLVAHGQSNAPVESKEEPIVLIVVEDDTSFREVVQTILEEMGHEVVVVANGKEALASLLEKPAALMITDIFMPEMEGLETIMQVRKRYPAIKMIAMSGGTPRGPGLNYLGMAQKFGAKRVLAKPFTAEQLAEAIKETGLGG